MVGGRECTYSLMIFSLESSLERYMTNTLLFFSTFMGSDCVSEENGLPFGNI